MALVALAISFAVSLLSVRAFPQNDCAVLILAFVSLPAPLMLLVPESFFPVFMRSFEKINFRLHSSLKFSTGNVKTFTTNLKEAAWH